MKRSIQTPINVPLMGLVIALTATMDKIAKSVILDFNLLDIADMK